MNRGRKGTSPIGGYTIVESLIFLAVSAVIFFSAMLAVSGRQNREFFTNAVRDFETRLLDIANNVSTGYYQNGNPLRCEPSSGGPIFPSGTNDLGTNKGCIFTGTVVKFGDGSNNENMIEFTMAGLKEAATGVNSTNLAEAKPKVIDSASSYSIKPIGAGVTVECVKIGSGSCGNNAAIGFFTTFEGASLLAENGGPVQANAIAFPTVKFNHNANQSITELNKSAHYATPTLNPGITICLRSGTTSQYALVTIGGGSSSNLAATSEIKSFSGATPPCN